MIRSNYLFQFFVIIISIPDVHKLHNVKRGVRVLHLGGHIQIDYLAKFDILFARTKVAFVHYFIDLGIHMITCTVDYRIGCKS